MAGNEVSRVFVSIGASTEGLKKGLNSALGSVTSWAADVAKFAAGDLLAGGIRAMVSGVQAVGDFFGESIVKASAFNETLSKTRVLLGDNAQGAEELAQTMARKGVASAKEVLDSYSGTYLALVNQGVAADVAAKKAGELEQRLADIGSQRDKSGKELREWVQSGLAGETQVLRNMNVYTSVTDLNEKRGGAPGGTSAGEPDRGQMAVGLIDEILAQTASAKGDYDATQFSYANLQRAGEVKMEQGMTEIGQFFLEAAQAFEYFKNMYLDEIIATFTDGRLAAAGQDVFQAVSAIGESIHTIIPDLGQAFVDLISGISRFTGELSVGLTASLSSPLSLLKSVLLRVGIAFIDFYGYLSKFVGGSGLPLDEWKAALTDKLADSEGVLAEAAAPIIDRGKELQAKLRAGSANNSKAEENAAKKTEPLKTEESVKSQRSAFNSLLSNVIGGDKKYENKMLEATQQIANNTKPKTTGVQDVAPSGTIKTAASALVGGLI